jgi:hypothetical protein
MVRLLHLDPECLTPEVAGLLRREAERLSSASTA